MRMIGGRTAEGMPGSPGGANMPGADGSPGPGAGMVGWHGRNWAAKIGGQAPVRKGRVGKPGRAKAGKRVVPSSAAGAWFCWRRRPWRLKSSARARSDACGCPASGTFHHHIAARTVQEIATVSPGAMCCCGGAYEAAEVGAAGLGHGRVAAEPAADGHHRR